MNRRNLIAGSIAAAAAPVAAKASIPPDKAIALPKGWPILMQESNTVICVTACDLRWGEILRAQDFTNWIAEPFKAYDLLPQWFMHDLKGAMRTYRALRDAGMLAT